MPSVSSSQQECFGAMTTASLFPNPACICLNLLLPISWIQMLCKSVGRQQLHSVPLSRAITGGILWGIPCSHHFSTPRSTRAPCLYTHKSACHFYCLLLFSQVTRSPLWCHLLFYPLPRGSAVCGLLSFPSASDFNLVRISPSFLAVVAVDWGGRLGCLVMAT